MNTYQEALDKATWALRQISQLSLVNSNVSTAVFMAQEGLRTAKFAQPMETGWLIENGKFGDELRYRTIDQGLPVWTADHMKAIRFARRADAELFAAEDDDAWRIAEHVWYGVTLQPHPTMNR